MAPDVVHQGPQERGNLIVQHSARIASARSKVGDSDRKAIAEEVALDILVDLEAVFPRALTNLTSDEEAVLHDRLLEKIRTAI